MLKKVSNFIVNKRYWILGIMLLVAIASVFAMQKVKINEDMTKYLPDDSAMKKGMDVMNEEFPEMEILQTIRVIADDLTEEQADELLNRLAAIPYVDSVTYEADSEDYNKDNHTLFVLNTEYDYGSSEELSIENALDESFFEYSIVWHNDDTSSSDIPAWIIAAALAILMVILFAMCGSWIEPVLFLIVIGIAIVINMGTNIIMGSVSDVTFSIAAILQLVLSMDYSIILINRYRQEKEQIGDKKQAMKEALTHAFSSIASSSLTTVVGLLMLVFMSFKIGMDLGIVLAKGVFISMVCVLTMMPGIILACDKLIQKTAKKELHIPMDWAAGFGYRLCHGLGVLFLFLFAGVYWLQSQAGISYTLQNEDPVAEVFPASNTLVMVYESRDEEAVSQLAAGLEADENIKSVMAYSTMLAKPYTAAELADEIADMGDDFSLDSSVINMLYYNYFTNGQTELMTASDFLNFVAGPVMENKTFSDYIDEGMRENIDLMKKFADIEALTTSMDAEGLADFFDMDTGDIDDLLLYYYIENGGVPTGNMTLAAFADFVINEVAKDETYGSMFDNDTLKQMEQLAVFTDATKMTTPYNYKEIASLLDMEADTVKLLFVYYYALSDGYTPAGMTLPDFVYYIQNDIASDPAFSSAFDSNTLEQINMLASFTDINTISKQMAPAELAGLIGMEESMVSQIFMMYYGSQNVDQGIPFASFTNFLVNVVMENPSYASSFDESTKAGIRQMNQLASVAASGQALSSDQLADIVSLNESMIQVLFSFKAGLDAETPVTAMSLQDFIDFLVNDIASNPAFSSLFDQATLEQLIGLQQMIEMAVAGDVLDAQALASVTGMDEGIIEAIFVFKSAETASLVGSISLVDFLAFLKEDIINNPVFAVQFDEVSKAGVDQLSGITNLAVSGMELDSNQLADITGLTIQQVEIVLGESSTATLSTFLDAAVNSVELDDTVKNQMNGLKQIVDLSVSGTPLPVASLVSVIGIDEGMVQILFNYKAGLDSADAVTGMTLSGFLTYLQDDVAKNPVFADFFHETALGELAGLQQIVEIAIADTALDAQNLADMTGMEAGMVETLFIFAAARSASVIDAMTLPKFLTFLIEDVSADLVLGAEFDTATIEQLKMLQQLVNLAASGEALTYQQTAQNLGMDEAQMCQLYILYWGQNISGKTLSLEQTIDFLLSDAAMSSSLDNNTRQQLVFLQNIMAAARSGQIYSYMEMGSLLGMDSSMVKMIYTYHEAGNPADVWSLSMHTIINFLVDNGDQLSSMMGKNEIVQIQMVQKLINGTVNGTSYTASALAELMGMDTKQAEQLYLLYVSRHGDTSGWTLSVKGFIDFINSDILNNSDFAGQFDTETAEMLQTAQLLTEAVVSGKSYTAVQMSELFEGLSEDLNKNTMELMYLYASSEKNSNPAWKMSMETLFNYLVADVLKDSRFAELIDDEMKQELYDAQTELVEGKEQLVAGKYSRLIITSAYPEEALETTAFLDELNAQCSDSLSGDFYFIGNSAMTYEMQQIFDRELLFITMLTAIAIFLIVALTFKSIFIPLILVLVVQCGVYATISVVGLQGGSMYYLALLIVECILMGATIDYGILFTNYYCESRITMPVKEALKAAYAGATHTILTSGLILILVTAIVGNFFEEPTVSAIVKTVSIGALCATLLILFILPGLLAVCDRFVVSRQR